MESQASAGVGAYYTLLPDPIGIEVPAADVVVAAAALHGGVEADALDPVVERDQDIRGVEKDRRVVGAEDLLGVQVSRLPGLDVEVEAPVLEVLVQERLPGPAPA